MPNGIVPERGTPGSGVSRRLLIFAGLLLWAISCAPPERNGVPQDTGFHVSEETEDPSVGKEEGKDMDMRLASGRFAEGGPIPRAHTREGADFSPPLSWSGVPGDTQSLALVCDDPDAPMGTWVHWVLYDMPPDLDGLPEGVPGDAELPSGARQGTNDFGELGYGGPMPPPGKPHHYVFTLYALDVKLGLPAGASKSDLESAMRGHIRAKARLTGTYKR